MNRPKLLDLYCRKGGASAGYIAAGFDVIGVDKEDHSDGYPGFFVLGDAIELIIPADRDTGDGEYLRSGQQIVVSGNGSYRIETVAEVAA